MTMYKYLKFSTTHKVIYMFFLQQQQGFKQLSYRFSTWC